MLCILNYMNMTTVILSLGKRKGLGYNHIMSSYASKKKKISTINLLPSLKKKKMTKPLYNLIKTADLVQMEDSFKQNSGNVLTLSLLCSPTRWSAYDYWLGSDLQTKQHMAEFSRKKNMV